MVIELTTIDYKTGEAKPEKYIIDGSPIYFQAIYAPKWVQSSWIESPEQWQTVGRAMPRMIKSSRAGTAPLTVFDWLAITTETQTRFAIEAGTTYDLQDLLHNLEAQVCDGQKVAAVIKRYNQFISKLTEQ